MSSGRKPRPAHEPVAGATGLRAGLVLASYRRHFAVRLDDGELIECVLRGRSLTLACGDHVQVSLMQGGGAIEAVAPRSTLFYRSDAFHEKLIAANVTQVIGVVAPDVAVDEELLTRWGVAAEAQRCRFVIVVNKADLPGHAPLLQRLAAFAAMGYPVVSLAATRDVAALVPCIAGQRSVLIGQSGMGKSTILNGLAPEAAARTGEVSRSLHAGRHTTTHSTLHPLPDAIGGWIVDSPGLKAFGLAHVDPDDIADAFPEFRPARGQCRFRDCRHDREPSCAFQATVARGDAAPYRLNLLRTLVAESTASRAPQTAATRHR
ncbi:MAG: ribosome small subunit-dependent GTPase A [Casimicrobiaceae bacterium]